MNTPSPVKKMGSAPPPSSVPPRTRWPSHASSLLRSLGRADKKRRRRILERTIVTLERRKEQQQRHGGGGAGGGVGTQGRGYPKKKAKRVDGPFPPYAVVENVDEAIEFYRYVLRRVGTPKGYKPSGTQKKKNKEKASRRKENGIGGSKRGPAGGGGGGTPLRPLKRPKGDHQLSEGDSSASDAESDDDSSTSSSSSSLSSGISSSDESSVTSDAFLAQHNDLCEVCSTGGVVICCATCNLVFHMGCARPVLKVLPPDDWSCAFCVNTGVTGHKSGSRERKRAGKAVAEMGRMLAEHREKHERAEAEAARSKARTKGRLRSKKGSEKLTKNERPSYRNDSEEDKYSDRGNGDGGGLPVRKELHQLLDTLTPEVNLEQPRSRRQRKAPTLYDPQICADSEWRSDGSNEWRYLLQAKEESERLAREKSGVASEAQCDTADTKKEDTTVDKDIEESEGRKKIKKFMEDRKKKKHVGKLLVGKKNAMSVLCTFCKDDESVKVCCFCACRVCFNKHAKGHTLLCDGCDAEYHTFCLVPPLKEIPKDEDWFCPVCRGEVTKEKREAKKYIERPSNITAAKFVEESAATTSTPTKKLKGISIAGTLPEEKLTKKQPDGETTTTPLQTKPGFKSTISSPLKNVEKGVYPLASQKNVNCGASSQSSQNIRDSSDVTGTSDMKIIGNTVTLPIQEESESKTTSLIMPKMTQDKEVISPIIHNTNGTKGVNTRKEAEGEVGITSQQKKLDATVPATSSTEKRDTKIQPEKIECKEPIASTEKKAKVLVRSVQQDNNKNITAPLGQQLPQDMTVARPKQENDDDDSRIASTEKSSEIIKISTAAPVTLNTAKEKVQKPVTLVTESATKLTIPISPNLNRTASAPKHSTSTLKHVTRGNKADVCTFKAAPKVVKLLPEVAMATSPAEVAKTTSRLGKVSSVSPADASKTDVRQWREAVKSPAEVAKTARAGRSMPNSKVDLRVSASAITNVTSTSLSKKRKTPLSASPRGGSPSSGGRPVNAQAKISSKQASSHFCKKAGSTSKENQQLTNTLHSNANTVLIPTQQLKVSATEEGEELPAPGSISIDGMFYCTHEDETLSQVAGKLRCDWRNLASLEENLEWYGKLTAKSKFKVNTLLQIPKYTISTQVKGKVMNTPERPKEVAEKVLERQTASEQRINTGIMKPSSKVASSPMLLNSTTSLKGENYQLSQYHPLLQTPQFLPEIKHNEQHSLRPNLKSLDETLKAPSQKMLKVEKSPNKAHSMQETPTNIHGISKTTTPPSFQSQNLEPKENHHVKTKEGSVPLSPIPPTIGISPNPRPLDLSFTAAQNPPALPSSSLALAPAPAANPQIASTPMMTPIAQSTNPQLAPSIMQQFSPTPTSTATVAATPAAFLGTAAAASHGTSAPMSPPVKVPRRKPGARECMQISRRFGANVIPQKYMDILLDYCTRGKVEHLIRMRERLDDHSRSIELQLAGLESIVKQKGEITAVVPPAEPDSERADEGRPGGAAGGTN